MEQLEDEFKEAGADSPDQRKREAFGDLTIPKHRFDRINLCLKETKRALADKTAETEKYRAQTAGLAKALLYSKAETALALHRAKNLADAKSLIDFSILSPGQDGAVPGLEEQVLRIKESRDDLFESQESAVYILAPVRKGDPLHKSIVNHIKNNKE